MEDNTLPIPVNISHIRSLHKFPAEVRRYIWKQVCDSGQNITEENVVAMTIKYETGVAFTNLNNELYTPKNIILAAKQVLGKNCFDLDPASCEFANGLHENKIAKSIITEQINGLQQPWYGDIWLHPPNYSEKVSKSGNFQGEWFKSAQERYQRHEITSCFVLLKTDFGKSWFIDTLKYPHCIFNKKIPFATPTGREKVLQDASHMLVYMGPNIIDFCSQFGSMGSIPGFNSWSYSNILTHGMSLSVPIYSSSNISGNTTYTSPENKRKNENTSSSYVTQPNKKIKQESKHKSELGSESVTEREQGLEPESERESGVGSESKFESESESKSQTVQSSELDSEKNEMEGGETSTSTSIKNDLSRENDMSGMNSDTKDKSNDTNTITYSHYNNYNHGDSINPSSSSNIQIQNSSHSSSDNYNVNHTTTTTIHNNSNANTPTHTNFQDRSNIRDVSSNIGTDNSNIDPNKS